MAWLNLNQSLNSLKGQITNFASEVLSEGAVQESGDNPSGSGDEVLGLQEKCRSQESEIKSLNSAIKDLQEVLQSERQARKNGVREDDSSWYWDPVSNNQRHQPITDDRESNYQSQIKALQEEISNLRGKEIRPPDDEVVRLREDNKALMTNLEDLDSQHQQAMERLLALKKELQRNFEVLKQEHEDLKNTNEEFAEEVKSLQSSIAEKDKVIEELIAGKADFDTLHHKYQNLERIHSLLRENAEKFQEENQDLHEEVFKLQEQVTKLEHEIELSTKHTELSDSVPRERYDDLLKELNDIKDRRISDSHLDEVNIDDNAKTVIESLKRDISELKHKLAQKQTSDTEDSKVIKTEKVLQLYNKYVNFELPLDYVGEMPTGDNIALHKIESAFKTLHSFKNEIDNLEHKLSEKTLSVNHLKSQIDDLTTENDFLSTDVHHYESELNEMKKNNDFLLNEIAALKNTSKLEPIIESHEDNLAKLETELEDCSRMNKTFESEVKKVENELREVRAEKVSLQTSLEDLKQKYTQMIKDFETLKIKSEAADGMEHDILAIQDDKLRNKSDEIDELRKQLNESNTNNEKLAIDIRITENDKVLLTKEVDDLKHEIETLNKAHKDPCNRIATEANQNKLQNANETTRKLELSKVLENQNDTLQGKNLEEKLETLSKANTKLNETILELTAEVTALRNREQAFIDENNTHKNASVQLEEKCSILERSLTDLKSNITEQKAQEMLQSAAISQLTEENKTFQERYFAIEKDLVGADARLLHAQNEFDEQGADLRSKHLIIDALNATIAEQAAQIIILNQNALDIQNSAVIQSQEIETLRHNISELNKRLTKSALTEEARKSLAEDKEVMAHQMHSLQEDLSLKNNEISKLRSQVEDLTLSSVEMKSHLDNKERQINEMNVTLVEITEKSKVQENTTQIENKEAIMTEIASLKTDLTNKDEEITKLQTKLHSYEANVTEFNQTLEAVNKEKADLINLVTLKHNESLQYHAEIQRLNQVLLEQTNELKRIEESISQNDSSCGHCDNLKVTLKEKDEIIKMLNHNVSEVDKIKSECANATESDKVMTEKCDSLEKSLAVQLEVVKKLTAENLQLSELEANSSRELARLRQHLLELEESYTQELMAAEQKLRESEAARRQGEQRARQASTVYTSNSIRANQEVETLRNQIKLLEKQREEVQSKLSEGDDTRERSEAALANLQIVLEQFQSDKERDIEAATEKLRGKMAAIEKQNGDLKQEIARLGAKLDEALAGLQAATRLGDQLETKVAIINDLKEQVAALQASVSAAEERYRRAVTNQQDKVDKELVKNLLLHYVAAPAQAQAAGNRTQVLRLLSTVLDFNQQECLRLGLTRGAATPGLAQEFVKFLQQESRPPAPPAELGGRPGAAAGAGAGPGAGPGAARGGSQGSEASAASRRSSGLGPQPNPYDVGHSRNPSTGSNNLLFQNIDNLAASVAIDNGVNQTRNNESAILKHVLKDM